MTPRATLYEGDSLTVMRRFPAGTVDTILTDPPYSSGTRREAAKGLRKSMLRSLDGDDWFGSDSLTTSGFLFFIRSCAVEWNRLLKPGGHVLCFIDWRMMPWCADAIERQGHYVRVCRDRLSREGFEVLTAGETE